MQKGREKKEEREGSTRRVKVERKRWIFGQILGWHLWTNILLSVTKICPTLITTSLNNTVNIWTLVPLYTWARTSKTGLTFTLWGILQDPNLSMGSEQFQSKNILLDHRGIKLELNSKRNHKKYMETKQSLLNHRWVIEEI
jgi:hypothetical protein